MPTSRSLLLPNLPDDLHQVETRGSCRKNRRELALICLFVPTNSRLLSYATCLAYERHEYRLTCTNGVTDDSGGGARGTGGSSAAAEESQPDARATRCSSNASGALHLAIFISVASKLSHSIFRSTILLVLTLKHNIFVENVSNRKISGLDAGKIIINSQAAAASVGVFRVGRLRM